MMIGIKDVVKLIGIAVIACCAVFVCTLFLNYNIDIVTIKSEIATEAGIAMYHAQVSMGKVTSAVSGGCLAGTSVVMLLFYVKNYIDTHGKELGILKALGHSAAKIAKHFWVFGLSIFIGCALGYALAFLYLPTFYKLQNAECLFPEIEVRFHPILSFLLVGAPAIVFSAVSVSYASLRLKRPALDLLKEKQVYRTKRIIKETDDMPFLKDLTRSTLKSRKTFVFLIAFSAFCFSAMVQMAMSMKDLADEAFAIIMITIGLILAFVSLFLSLSSVVKGNAKTIAMMRIFGYQYRVCGQAVLGGYRPFSYIGFVLGTIYQYVLLKIMVTLVFANVANVPAYHFDFRACVITLTLFVLTYEIAMYGYSRRIRKLSVKSVMSE